MPRPASCSGTSRKRSATSASSTPPGQSTRGPLRRRDVSAGPPTPPPVDDVPCAVLVEMITDYLDRSIPSDLRVRVDAHLALCPGCTSVLEQVRRVIRVAGHLTDDDVDALPAADRDRLLAAFRAARHAG